MGKSKHEQPVVAEPVQSEAAPVEPTAAPIPEPEPLGPLSFRPATGRLGSLTINPDPGPAPAPYVPPPVVPAPPTDLPSGPFGFKAP